MNMEDTIAKLTYLKETNASPEFRNALQTAIVALESIKRNDKYLKIKKDLDSIDIKDPEFSKKVDIITKDLTYPEHEWIPCNARKIFEALSTDAADDYTEFHIPNVFLDKPLHVLEDDGMGYGAHNTYAFAGCAHNDEIQIWV